ncbi:MAG TPA: MFS transporter [Thermomicrobiales bacterium]|nr:MFS transporter [Thermomicrobiales bacterium]
MSTSAIPGLRGVYYGWVMLLTLSFTEVTSWGILYYSFSVFLTPMQAELGWSIAQMTGAYSAAILISGLAAIPVGRWLDRHGPRWLMTAGSIAATLLVVAWSQVDSIIAFYVVWGLIGLTQAAVLYEPALQAVAVWFRRKRSRALTILTFVGGFASVIYIPLAAWLAQTYGWRDALLVLAAILGVTTIPLHALVLRRRPADVGQAIDGDTFSPQVAGAPQFVEPGITTKEAIRTRVFWWLTAAFVLTYFGNVAITVHLIPYLVHEGYSVGFAATAAGLIGLLALPGRLIFTPLGSRIPRHYVTALIFSLQVVALLALLLIPGKPGVFIFVVLFGAGFGAITPARAALVADLFGTANYGTISGVLAFYITMARGIAPVAAGILLGLAGSYAPVIWTTVAVSAMATVAALQAKGDASESAAVTG